MPRRARDRAAGSFKRLLGAGGWYASRLRRHRFSGVLVLCYHGVRRGAHPGREQVFSNLHIASETFDAHCRVLADCCHPISLSDWRQSNDGGHLLPARPVLVTFDDGYRSVFETARPILKRYRIPAVMFVCSEPIRRQQLFWFDALAREAGEVAVSDFITLSPSGAASMRLTPKQASPGDPLAPMTVDHLKALADDGFEIGVHTATHVRLSTATAADQTAELEGCRDFLCSSLGCPITTLAYPWGQPGTDYTNETVTIAERLGFDFGFTTRSGFARPDESPLERSRFVVLASVEPAELAHRILYSWR
ncbi:MAG TPA: polysaccharide deacetylase family protein [Vicinamibacterales bacterium]